MTKNIMLLKKNGTTSEDVPHKVESISIFQFMKTLNVVKDILKIAKEDQSIANAIENFMNANDETAVPEVSLEKVDILDEEAAKEQKAAVDKEQKEAYRKSLMEAFEVILTKVPEKAFELLSINADIDSKTLEQQKLLTVFDIFDAIVEVNDVFAIIERAKKSLDVTSSKMKFKQKVEQSIVQ